MRKIKLVQQTTDTNCTSACIAMLTGLHIDKVHEEFHDKFRCGEINPRQYLGMKGFLTSSYNCEEADLYEKGIYILCVPSLNIEADNHNIVVYLKHGKIVVFDPNKGRLDKKYYVSKLEKELLVNEVDLKAWTIDYQVYGVRVIKDDLS